MTVNPESPGVETITGDQLTAAERERLVWMLDVARERVFPSALGASENLLGESPAQDFYFRLFLAHLLTVANKCGVAAMIGSIDDVWGFVDDAYDKAKRACGPKTRRCARETVRQLLSSQWRKNFDAQERAYTFDERDGDWEPERGATVAFSFTAGGESHPVVISTTVRMFRRDDGSRIDIVLPKVLPDACRIDPIETRALPHDDKRLCEQSAVVLQAIARLLPEEPRELTKQLRKLAESETADAERTQRFQTALGRLRRDGPSADAVEELHSILDDPEPDIRQGHADVDKLRNASPTVRRDALARIRKIAEGVLACLLIVFIVAYLMPTPLGAAVRARVRHFFDRIVGAPAESQPSRSAHGAISVAPPLDIQLLEQRIDARETTEFAYISSNIGATCVDGSLQAFGQFLNVPNTPPFVVLRNNEILNTVDTVSNGEVTFRDYNILANRAYSYKLAKLDPVSGEYHSSSPKSTRTPKCRPETATPVLDTSSVTPTEGGAPLTVTCHASAHGPNGEGIQYQWSFGGGEELTTRRETINHTYKYRQDEVVSLTVLADGGGVLRAAVQQPISITSGPRPPLLSQVEEYKQFGQGEAHPDGGPVGTLFHFRVFPRLSPVGARPVLYRWSFDECRRRFDSRSPDPMPPNADCASPRLSSPEYQRRFTVSGQYTAQVEVTYDDGEVDVVSVATVNVGLRERVWYSANGGMARAGIPVPAGVTDPDAYKPIKAPP